MMNHEESSLTASESLDIVYNALMAEQGSREHMLTVAKDELKFQLDKVADVTFARDGAKEGVSVQLHRWLMDSKPALGGLWGGLLTSAFSLVDFNELAERLLKEVKMYVITDNEMKVEKIFFSAARAMAAVNESLSQAGLPLSGQMESGDTFTIGDKHYCYFEE